MFNSTRQFFSILSEKLKNLGINDKEIKMVGRRISFSDTKLKFSGRFCTPCALPW